MITPLDTRPQRGPRPPDISSDATLRDTDVAPNQDADNATVDIERLAHDIARAGINALTDDHLDLIGRAAHAVGVRPATIDLLLDTSRAEVIRARAYGRITTKILNAAWAATPRRPEPTVLGHPPDTDISSVNRSQQPLPPSTRKDPP